MFCAGVGAPVPRVSAATIDRRNAIPDVYTHDATALRTVAWRTIHLAGACSRRPATTPDTSSSAAVYRRVCSRAFIPVRENRAERKNSTGTEGAEFPLHLRYCGCREKRHFPARAQARVARGGSAIPPTTFVNRLSFVLCFFFSLPSSFFSSTVSDCFLRHCNTRFCATPCTHNK